MSTLPFPDDHALCDAMDVLHDIKAVVNSIRMIVEVDTDDAFTDLKDRAETVHRLCFALERMLGGVSDQLKGVHQEWVQRFLTEERKAAATSAPPSEPASESGRGRCKAKS